MDRIDLVCQVEPVPTVELVDGARSAGHAATMRARVVAARMRQLARLGRHGRALQRRHGRPHASPGSARGEPGRAPARRPRPHPAGGAATTGAPRGAHDRRPRGTGLLAESDLDEALSYRLDGWERVAA